MYCTVLRTVLYCVLCCAVLYAVCCVEALTPRAALCAAQTVDYAAYDGGGWPARRDGLTLHSSGAVYSGGDGCTAQPSFYRGVCSGAPPAGTALRTGDTLTWAAGADDHNAIAAEPRVPAWHLHAATSEMAGWEICFAH